MKLYILGAVLALCIPASCQMPSSPTSAPQLLGPDSIVLVDERGQRLVLELTGPRVIDGSTALAEKIQSLDQSLANFSGSLPEDRIAAAREFREAALFELNQSVTIARHTSSLGISSTSEARTDRLTEASFKILQSQFQPVVATYISTQDNAPLQYVTDRAFRTSNGIPMYWTNYTSGMGLRVQAYRFRRSPTVVCDGAVIVNDDPSTVSLSC